MDLLTRVLNTPFIELDVDIDFDALYTEYRDIVCEYEFKSYHSNNLIARNWYAKSWSGICLQSSDGGLYTDMFEGPIKASQPTEVLRKCPEFGKLIDQLGCTARARIMRIAPGRSLIWHSHILEHGTTPTTLTVQVPIVMPKEFTYCVVHKDEFKWWKRFHKPGWFKSLSTARFEPGRAYIFNNYHYHNVYNKSNEYRVTLMLYLDLKDSKVQDLVRKSLKRII